MDGMLHQGCTIKTSTFYFDIMYYRKHLLSEPNLLSLTMNLCGPKWNFWIQRLFWQIPRIRVISWQWSFDDRSLIMHKQKSNLENKQCTEGQALIFIGAFYLQIYFGSQSQSQSCIVALGGDFQAPWKYQFLFNILNMYIWRISLNVMSV